MKKFFTLSILLFSISAFSQQAGIPDSTFSLDGKTTLFPGTGWNCAYDVVGQADGKIIVVGTAVADSNFRDVSIIRLNDNGSYDTTFNHTGKAKLNIDGQIDIGTCVLLQQDGKIVVGGHGIHGGQYDFILMRFNTNGSLDTQFGTNGVTIVDIDSTSERTCGIAFQPDGKIVMGGYADYGVNKAIALARFTSNGLVDSTFGTYGKVITDINPDGDDILTGLAVTLDGKILGAGTVYGQDNYTHGIILRYNSNGGLDNSFNSGGVYTDNVYLQSNFSSLLLQLNGKFATIVNNTIVRQFTASGNLDPGFGGNSEGAFTTNPNGHVFTKLLYQPDGKYVASGTLYGNAGENKFMVGRLAPNGTTDGNFGEFTVGIQTTNVTVCGDKVYGSAIMPDGKIVLVGEACGPHGTRFGIVRYLSGLNVGLAEFTKDLTTPLLYPNPLTSIETLTYTLRNDETISINLIDNQGKLIAEFVKNEKRKTGKNTEVLTLPENLASGTYFIQILSATGKVAIPVVK